MISYHEGIVGAVAVLLVAFFIRDARRKNARAPTGATGAGAPGAGRGRRIAIAVSCMAVVAGAFISGGGPDSVPWSLRLLDRAARVLFFACGMGGEGYGGGRSLSGRPWRECFEQFALRRVGPGDRDGVASVDVNIPAHTPLVARVHTPHGHDDDGSALLPVLVWYHGGGHVIGAYDQKGTDATARALARAGPWRVVVPEYRLAPEHPFPAAVIDAHATADWAARTYAGARLVLGGDSAGGNLAAVAARLATEGVDVDRRPCCAELKRAVAHQLLVYPKLFPARPTPSATRLRDTAYLLPAPLRAWFDASYLGDRKRRAELIGRHPLVSPMAAAGADALRARLAGAPSATFVHAGHDPLRDEGVAYASALRGADGVGAVVELEHPRMIHGFFTMAGLPGTDRAQALADAVDAVNAALAEAGEADGDDDDDDTKID